MKIHKDMNRWKRNPGGISQSLIQAVFFLLISYLLTDDAPSKHQPKVNVWLSTKKFQQRQKRLHLNSTFLLGLDLNTRSQQWAHIWHSVVTSAQTQD